MSTSAHDGDEVDGNRRVDEIAITPACETELNCSDSEELPLLAARRSSLPPSYTSEERNVDPSIPTTKTYKRRFWILTIFSLFGLFQCIQWNTWGPISASALAVFPDWQPSTIPTMVSGNSLSYIINVFPLVWVARRKGLRVGLLMGIAFIVAGTTLRVACFHTSGFKWACYACSFLLGMGGCIILAMPSMLAATWFPPNERTTATAIAQATNLLGGSVSYISPFIVSSPGQGTSNATIKGQIELLLYIHMGMSLALLLVALIYCPDKPPLPPSVSSATERLDFVSSFKRLRGRTNLWIPLIVYGISYGVPTSLIPVLNLILGSIGINQTEAKTIGQVSLVVPVIVTMICARLTDLLYGYLKLTIIVMFITTTGAFYWLYLLYAKVIPIDIGQVCASVTIGFSIILSTNPLFYELASEVAFPCPEVVIGGLLGVFRNCVCTIMYFLFYIPDIGYTWFMLTLLGSTSLTLVPIVCIKEDYHRSILDRSLLP